MNEHNKVKVEVTISSTSQDHPLRIHIDRLKMQIEVFNYLAVLTGPTCFTVSKKSVCLATRKDASRYSSNSRPEYDEHFFKTK